MNPIAKVMNTFIFSTSIQNIEEATIVGRILHNHLNISRHCFDLEDWEKILKIESEKILDASKIESLLAQYGYKCHELRD